MNVDTGKVYEGEDDVAAAVKRGEHLVELPHKADPACRLCKGKGGVRSYGTLFRYGVCPACYPDHPQKAVTWKKHIATLARSGQ